jgi:type VI secretion system protein ImpA
VSLLRDDILNPLPGPDPKGQNLRYSPVYEKIKEARQEDEDDIPQGEWQRKPKKADFAVVIKLASDALANNSKDLQLAAWLSEALVRREGLPALPQCLKLFHQLQVQFWNTLYPQLEGSNPEFRVAPQEWFAARCDYLLRKIPLTSSGFDWFRYTESRAVGYDNAPRDERQAQIRQAEIADGKITAEEFDKAFSATPKSFYAAASACIENSLEALAGLEAFCAEKYRDDKGENLAPSFSKLRNVVDQIQHTINLFLRKKQESEPPPIPQPEAAVTMGRELPLPLSAHHVADVAQVSPSGTGPVNAEQAFAMVERIAEYLRALEPSAVAPYLLSRSLRWGELRSAAGTPGSSLLIAPSTETRQSLIQLCQENNWTELLATAESAVMSPCGRAWLDPHRYSWRACQELGYTAAGKAICAELKALLADFPTLPDWVLNDDTLVANQETRSWLEQHVLEIKRDAPLAVSIIQPQTPVSQECGNGVVDQFEVAMQMARSGRLADAIEVLDHQNVRENSGRERFLRQLQIAQLCLATGHPAVACPILQNLFSEIQRRDLLEWESPRFMVPPLALLVQCIDKTTQDAQQRSQAYNLLCRLEPAMALQLQAR